MISVKIKRIDVKAPLIPLPSYESAHAAGMDIRAAVQTAIAIEPGQRKLVPTGIAIELPDGFEAQIRPRSGLAVKKGLSMLNNPGTIDADYRGEIKVILVNHGEDVIQIERGDRIAQMVFAPVIRAEITEVENLSPSERGTGGFGSTGKK